jgi:hypothetical protein
MPCQFPDLGFIFKVSFLGSGVCSPGSKNVTSHVSSRAELSRLCHKRKPLPFKEDWPEPMSEQHAKLKRP